MIKLTYGQLNDPMLANTIHKLSQESGWASPAAAYNISRIYRQVSKLINEARTEFTAFSEKFALKDENGVNVPAKVPGPLPFELKEESKEEFEAQLKEFFKTEKTIESYPITIEALGDVKISPADFMVLEAFMASSGSSEGQPQNVVPFPQEQSPSH